MKTMDTGFYHRLIGMKKPRITYHKKDFLDYTLMTVISAVVIYVAYGEDSLLAKVGVVLCLLMIVVFPIRHGAALRVPLIMRKPQGILYMIIYKIHNMRLVYIVAVGVLLLENYVIFLTPNLPHHVELMRTIGFGLFYLHLAGITAYRTVSLVAHLRKRELVREVLLQTSWKNFISKQSNVALEILHAYFTGLLTHIILVAPWYIVLTFANFSVIFLLAICAINVFTHLKFLKVVNSWFYRDHWLGHNSEVEFVYFHGTHHDAIPSGLIGVAGTGHLEGFMRHVLGFPTPFYNPVVACLFYTIDVKNDIDTHQYLPGIFPRSSTEFQEVTQHSTHHFGRLEPYGFGIKLNQPNVSEELRRGFKSLPEELTDSIRLDEQLTGFEWDNPRYRRYLKLFHKYHN